MTTFLERLLQAAEFAGIGRTQSEIADALGINRQTVHRWFREGVEPSADNCFDIATKWGIDGRWLKKGEGEMLKPAGELPHDERELLRSYRSATPQTRQLLRKMARAATKSVLFIAATIPPLLSPANHSEAAMGQFAHQLPSLCIMLNMIWRRMIFAFLSSRIAKLGIS
jgi:transcriptional regulator with XRE-family HTH domain